MSYTPVLDLSTLNANLMTAIEIAIPKKIKEYIPNVVKAPLPLLAVASQNKVVKPFKNSLAKSWINPNPLLMALMISVPMYRPPISIVYTYV